jgi:hypothetical protein
MPDQTCRTRDPVELLLRSILQRALLLAGAGSMVACVAQLEPEDSDAEVTPDPNEVEEDAGGGPAVRVDAGGQPPLRDAGVALDASGPYDAGFPVDARIPRDAGPRDAAVLDVNEWEAGPGDAARDATALPEDAGAPLGPPLVCETTPNFPVRAAGLTTALPYDYISIRRRSGLPSPADAGSEWTETQFQVLSETGVRCSTAQAQSACLDVLGRHPANFVSTTCVQICTEDSVVTTQGDVVKRWTGASDLKQLLGNIDSIDEALLFVSNAGYTLHCGDALATSAREVAGGYEVYATRMTKDCAPIIHTRYHLRVSTAGEISVLGSITLSVNQNACAGRKPAGLVSHSRDRGRSKLGDYLAHLAHLEAASVVAFERMACELNAHGAPLELVDLAITARGDEVRHAQLMGIMARGHGGDPVKPAVEQLPLRTLEEIALENAVEGCVRETYGALVGGYQAQHARDSSLRAAMHQISADEARHAALSHRVQRWLLPQLSPEARERVRHAQQRAVFELAAEVAVPVDAELRLIAGLPSPPMGRILLDELSRALWNPQGQRSNRTALG